MPPNDRDRRDHGRRNEPAVTALTVRPEALGLPSKPLTSADSEGVSSLLEYAASRANVLGPLTQIDYIPPGYVLSLRVVLLPLDGMLDEQGGELWAAHGTGRHRLKSGQYLDNGLWHKLPGSSSKPDKVSMEKAALDLIASTSACDYLPPRRVDDRSETHYWEMQCGIRFRTFDGSYREVWDGVEYDLRDGAPEAEKALGKHKSVKGLSEARRFGARNAISKARNRAIRAAFGIRPLEVWQAERPFVFPVLQWLPDMNNPEIAKMVAAKELGLIGEMYGSESSAPAPIEIDTTAERREPERRRGPARQLPDHGNVDELEGIDPRDDRREPVPARRQDDREEDPNAWRDGV